MADVFGVAYDAYKQNKKAKQERRDRLAGLYAAASTCMESLSSSLREGKTPLKRSAEFAIYIDEFNEVLTPNKKRPSSGSGCHFSSSPTGEGPRGEQRGVDPS